MTTTHTASTRTGGRIAGAIAATYAGPVLTVAATGAPYVDGATGHGLADHIRHGYPTYTQQGIDAAVDAWLGILAVAGVLGIVCWSGAIWAVKALKGWARPSATVMFVGGTGLAPAALLTHDSSGEVGPTPMLGWIGMLPPLAGLAAVWMPWATPAARGHSEAGS